MPSITPIFTASASKARVDTYHVHGDDDHIPMREIEDRGPSESGIGNAEGVPPTTYRYTVWECPRTDCHVKVVTSMLHQLQLADLGGLVVEHDNGVVDLYGEVPVDWATRPRQIIAR